MAIGLLDTATVSFGRLKRRSPPLHEHSLLADCVENAFRAGVGGSRWKPALSELFTSNDRQRVDGLQAPRTLPETKSKRLFNTIGRKRPPGR